MLRVAAFGLAGAGAALWTLLGTGPRSDRAAAEAMRWPWLATGIAVFVSGLALGPTAAGLSGAIVGICSWCAACVARSRRNVAAAESVAQFAAVLANQAQVSRTVVDALETAAPLATGPIAKTASRLVDECRSVGVEAAAQQFADGADGPVAAWLADVVAVAAASGGQWVPILGVLEAEAAEAAGTARHFNRHVAANLPQLALAAVLGAAVAVGSALVSPDAWEWMTGPQGQRVGLAAVVIAVVTCARPLSSAWETLR